MENKYSNIAEMEAYKAGFKEGHIQGILSYQKHLVLKMQRDRVKLNDILLEQKSTKCDQIHNNEQSESVDQSMCSK